jgi:UDP-N-acetylmuramoyl-L-alanyl-D-glutamate--2,6-diaminopimelate ligase
MTLGELFSDDVTVAPRLLNLAVRGLSADSRTVQAGDLFVAIRGAKADGLSFVDDALRAGAVAVMGEAFPDPPLAENVAFILVDDVRRALARAAARCFPRQPAMIAAVTGTSGKTSVVAFARQIWTRLGRQAASIGTLGLVLPKAEIPGSLTTPDPVKLHRTLDQLAADGVSHVAIEASSHGLDQRRLDGVRVKAGAFTNLSRDHLDYHPSLEAYLGAKLRLFDTLMAPGSDAVINVDAGESDAVIRAAKARRLKILTVGRADADIRLIDVRIDGLRQQLQVLHRGRTRALRLPLVGSFQVENALVAAGLAIASGEEPPAVFAALEGLKGARGRLELVGHKEDAPIFVDYAHKPDALAKALDALRPYAPGRLVVVFGAGGDRDIGKRPMMGAIAAQRADRVIVTDDNPRTEDPAAIRAAILAAAPGATEIADRGTAIGQAITELKRGDVLLIAGKGHESGQILGDRVRPFTDHGAVAAALGNEGA